jgi:hypothetical protein
MLSRSELLYLKGELEVEGNVNYDRVLACRIKKKVEKSVRDLEETIPLLSLKPGLKEWLENYGITVIRKLDGDEEKAKMGFFSQNRQGPVDQSGMIAAFARRKSRVQIPPGPLPTGVKSNRNLENLHRHLRT